MMRRFLRQWLHGTALRLGFCITRVKPFEAAIRRWELSHDDFYFVQIGAHNGVTSDPFTGFVSAGYWHCLLVEPQRRFVEILQTIYCDRPRIRVCNCAIGTRDEMVRMYRVRDDTQNIPYWATQLASLRYDVIASHEDRIPGLRSLIVEEMVPSRTLASLVAEQDYPRLDLLAIDVEGFDFEVVKQIDLLPQLPKFIYYEHGHLSELDYRESLAFLAKRSYRTHSVNNGDTFAEHF
jgi:FkbM family methyltransferase